MYEVLVIGKRDEIRKIDLLEGEESYKTGEWLVKYSRGMLYWLE